MTITDTNSVSPRKRVGLIFFIFVLIAAGSFIPGRLVVATSFSIEHLVFFKRTIFNQDEVKKGSYVLIELYTDVQPDCMPCLISKKVACTEGDTLGINGNEYFCNDEFIGKSKKFSQKGKPTNPYRQAGKLQKGQIFLTGNHKDSYDSKYFGPRKTEDVKAILQPII